jgi:hypothetical protein
MSEPYEHRMAEYAIQCGPEAIEGAHRQVQRVISTQFTWNLKQMHAWVLHYGYRLNHEQRQLLSELVEITKEQEDNHDDEEG